MTSAGLLFWCAAAALLVILPLLVLVWRIAIECPVIGMLVAAPLLVGAYVVIPHEPLGQRLDWTVFVFVAGLAASVTVTAFVGVVRSARARPPSTPGLPRARMLVRDDQR